MQQIQNQSLVSFMLANPQQGIAVTNPATGELLGYPPVSTENDILNSIERAHVARK
ncbi:succinate-semialdehyde dehydrogenase (NADP(+)), partial [Vibrio sp. YT-19(2023)]|nr:succinate-semialdehyde dehydrogenase (NADP(+)) [Vibrio sp. YT-19(2023)]